MAKMVHDDVLDGALNIIKNNSTQISVCSDTPTTYSQATTGGTYMLAIKSDLSGTDFTVANGTSGRKVTTGEFTGIAITDTGTATHVCLCDVDDRLLYVTTCTSQVLTDGGTVTIPAWKIEIADPTA